MFGLARSRLPRDRSKGDVYLRAEHDTQPLLRRFMELAMLANQVRDLAAMTAVLLVTLKGLNNPMRRRPECEQLLDELTREVTGWLTPRNP